MRNSLLGKNWIKKDLDSRFILNISQKYFLSKIASNLLSTRTSKITEIKNFLEPTMDFCMPDPLIFNDMEKAGNRILKAIKNKEKIAVIGDYDVDGLTSTVLLKKYLTVSDFIVMILLFKYILSNIFSEFAIFEHVTLRLFGDCIDRILEEFF